MSITYTAESLDDIAIHFDHMAAEANLRARLTAGTEKKLLHREAVIWGQAASTLRQTALSKADATS
jgi:hypothetical protein